MDDDGTPTPNRGGAKAKRQGGKKKRAGGDDDAVSPLLAAWAQEESSASAAGATRRAATATDSDAEVLVPSASAKKRRNNSKRSDQRAARAVLSDTQAARANELLEDITGMLNVTNCDVPRLVSRIAMLVDLHASSSNDLVLLPTLKSILSSRPDNKEKKRPAYRLAWVGSDAAICHVGTSLHKVPLARLQEMYLLLGYGRWELLEVIRILGPFPNVRNTLQGDVQAKKRDRTEGSREGAMLRVKYASMIDGTGKQLLAGNDVKTVDLDVWYASAQALVCTVSRGTGREDGLGGGKDDDGEPLAGDGADILLFVAEDDVDEQLEKLRAA